MSDSTELDALVTSGKTLIDAATAAGLTDVASAYQALLDTAAADYPVIRGEVTDPAAMKASTLAVHNALGAALAVDTPVDLVPAAHNWVCDLYTLLGRTPRL